MPSAHRVKPNYENQTSAQDLRLVSAEKRTRHWELDFCRGIAVLAMVVYHLIFDLIKIFKVTPFVSAHFWILGPDLIGGSFLMIAGAASVFQSKSGNSSTFMRGGRLFGIGMILTLVSLIFTSKYIIAFGILHCIGFSIMVGPFFLRYTPIALATFSIPVLILGYYAEHIGYYADSAFWIQENLLSGRRMIDFFSPFPFFAYYLLGVSIGKKFEKSMGKRRLIHSLKPIVQIGKQSLTIYLLHQPILISLIYVIRKIHSTF